MLRGCVSLVLGSVLLVAASGSLAQNGTDGLDTERFKAAIDSQGILLTEGGQGEKQGDLSLKLFIHYSRNPLVLTSGDDVVRSLLADRVAASFQVAMGITDWLTLGVELPAAFYQKGVIYQQGTGLPEDLASAVVGDVRAVPKLTLLREKSHGVSLAFLAPVTLPSGDEGAFMGSQSVTVSPCIAVSRRFLDEGLMLALNLGVWLQEKANYADLEIGHEVFYRIGASLRLAEKLWALGEVSAGGKLENIFENLPRETPMEWLVGIRFQAPRDILITGGGAVGSLPGWGTPHYRAFLGVAWAPRQADRDGDGISDDDDRCPTEPGSKENDGCPWGDKDSDGLLDNQDQCPQEAGPAENRGCPWGDEDGDGLQDNLDRCPKEPGPTENGGCPWGDQDGDGIKDNLDKCPSEEGPVANDGCPWGDSDADGIKDNLDRCPDQPEDQDGFEDQDGCPDLDNDRDGVADQDDKCPDEPETINGFQDMDGCPDKGKVVVVVKKEKIEILQKVHFATGKAKILRDSFNLLNQVALTLKAHPEIHKIRVDGHTDARGRKGFNQRLSQRRADAVRDYLVRQGVEPQRLEAMGFGESQPIASNRFAKGREKNRRVEFTIIERE